MVATDRPIKLSFSTAFQVKYCIVIAVIFICANALLYLLMNKTLSGTYLENLRTLYHLEQNLPLYLSIMALLQTLFVLILTLVVTLLVSHQIAGPVFRYEKILAEMVSGVFPQKVATRQSDQLKPMVNALNDLTTRCRDTFEAAQNLSGSVELQLSAAPEEENLSDLLQQVADLRRQMGDDQSERVVE